MRRKLRPIVVAVAVVAGLSACDPPQPWSSRLVSVNADGTDAGNDRSDSPAISPDGTKVAFESWADDLGPTDTNGDFDVYVRDLTTGATELVSVNAAGTDSVDGRSLAPVFSPDGTQIAFLSMAALTPDDDDPGSYDVYLRDLTTDVTTLVSADETPGVWLGHALEPAFSPDGTAIAFSTERQGNQGDVYVRDLASGDLTLVSVNATGTGGGNRRSRAPAFVGPDGDAVAFSSLASDLSPVDTNGQTRDVFLRDLTTGTTTLVSATASGTGSGNGSSGSHVVSPDGSRIAFSSTASDLGPTDTNGATDVYVRDLTAQDTALVSVNATGTDSANNHSGATGLLGFSPDGTGLVFDSAADDLGPTDTNGLGDTYFRDLTAQTTTLVSVNAAGTDSGNSQSVPVPPGFAGSGRRVLFHSDADDLGPRDTNQRIDLYVRDLATGTTTLVATRPDRTDSGNGSSLPGFDRTARFSADGRHLAYVSYASDLGDTDTNGTGDVYVATLHAADLSVEGDAEPEPVSTGSPVTYNLQVDNTGPDPADRTTVALLLPEGTTFAEAEAEAATGAGECTEPTPEQPRLVVCDLGDVAVGDVVDITITADVTAPTGTALVAIAAINASTVDENTSDNSTTIASTVS